MSTLLDPIDLHSRGQETKATDCGVCHSVRLNGAPCRKKILHHLLATRAAEWVILFVSSMVTLTQDQRGTVWLYSKVIL